MGEDNPKAPRELRDYLVLLRQKDSTGQPFVLVGGQAVNYWAALYLQRELQLRSLLPFLSKDADFIGTKTEAAQVAQQTGWHLSPPLFGGGPVEAVLSFPDYYEQEPEEGATFTRAMHSLTSGIIQEIVHVVDTSTVKLADDVGGASGTLLHGLMAGNPQLQGMVVDLPDVVRSAETAAVALGLAGRFRAVASDFFDYIPEADLYLLKYILHDWNDADAVRILKRCREAMRPEGRVIVIERLLGNIGQSRLAPLADLNMMVLLTVQERTLGELRQLGQNSPIFENKSLILER